MKTRCIVMLALLLPVQWMARVSGRVLDREAKPLVNGRVTYTNVSSYSGPTDAPLSGTPTSKPSDPGTGKTYSSKTDKNGEFIMVGVQHGSYRVEIFDSTGKLLYTGRTLIQAGNATDREPPHVLNIDLSTIMLGKTAGEGESNLATGKSKEEIAMIRQENRNAIQINRLIESLQTALEVKDWKNAVDDLHQLIALDPNRWEFYQNLGTIQGNQGQYAEAVQAFEKGIQLAEKLQVNVTDAEKTKADIAGMLIYQGDSYAHLDKVEEAAAAYTRAAELSTEPAVPLARACSAQANHGNLEAATAACNKAIVADPSQWQPYQTLGGVLNDAGKSQEALDTYQKGVEAARKAVAAKPDSTREKNGMGQMLNAEGNIYAHLRQFDQAAAAFNEAASVSVYAALPYFNLCATYYNTNRMEEAVAACDQAIASDPSMAEAYYIKASALFGKGTLEKGRYTAPRETREALTKYLAMSPYSMHAATAREMLEKLDSEVETTVKPTASPVAKPATKAASRPKK